MSEAENNTPELLCELPADLLQTINAQAPEQVRALDAVFNCLGAEREARVAALQALVALHGAEKLTKEHLLQITETGIPARRIILQACGIEPGSADERNIYHMAGHRIVEMLLVMMPKLFLTPHGMMAPGARVQIARDGQPDLVGTLHAVTFTGLYRVKVDGRSAQHVEEVWPCECVPLSPAPNAAGGYFVPVYRTPSGHDIAFIYPDMIAIDAPGALLCAQRFGETFTGISLALEGLLFTQRTEFVHPKHTYLESTLKMAGQSLRIVVFDGEAKAAADAGLLLDDNTGEKIVMEPEAETPPDQSTLAPDADLSPEQEAAIGGANDFDK